MRGLLARIRSLGRELRRRRVYRVGVLYLAGAAATIQVADAVVDALGIPDWIFALLVLAAITGVPVVLVLAWIYDVTDEGVRRSEDQGVPGLRGAFAALVIVVSVGMGAVAWTLWLRPGAGRAGEGVPIGEAGAETLEPARIAILYFDDHSRDGSLDYLSAGLTEGLIHKLAQVEGLEVVSRNGVKPFRHASVPLDSIVEALDAGSLVEGSVTRSGDRLKLTVQLVDGATGAHLSSRVLERHQGELFALQDSLTSEVARGLRRRLGTELRVREVRSRAGSVEAWRLLLEAVALREEEFPEVRMDDPDGAVRVLHRADSLLAEAVRLDSDWVDPLIVRARVARDLSHELSSTPGVVYDSTWNANAFAYADRAVSVNEASAEARLARAQILADRARSARPEEAARLWDRAEDDVRGALALDPDLAEASWQLARISLERGRFAEAHQAARRALEADRFLEVEADALHELYYSALNLEEFAEARRWCDEGRARFPGESRFVVCQLFLLVSVPDVEPDVGRAWRLADSLRLVVSARNRDRFDLYGTVLAAKVAARAGLADSARSVLARAAGPDPPGWLTYDLAHAYVLLGDRARALDHLERYVAFDPTGRDFLGSDWWFRPLRGDPRFERLLENR